MFIAICEDKPEQLRKYTALIQRCASVQHAVADLYCFASGNEMLFQMQDRLAEIDLIYLDVHMPGFDGIETANKLRKQGFVGDLVMLTVDPAFVFHAFDFEALSYLLKEKTTDDRFAEVFARAHQRALRRRQEYICLNCAGESRSVAINSILYFEVDKRIITVHYLHEGKETDFSFYSSLEKLENALTGRGFIRNYRSQLVALGYITKLTGNVLILRNGTQLPVGRAQLKEIREALLAGSAD